MNMFDKAKANAKPAVTTKVAEKSKKVEIDLPGIESVAQIDALIKTLTGVKESLSAGVKSEAMTHFLAMANGTRPKNFTGLDGKASASVEMRQRASNSPLSEAEEAVLLAANLPIEEVVTVEELFVVNPVYANDSKLLKDVSKKIEKLVPDDFFIMQQKQSKKVVAEKTIDEAFKAHAAREVIEMITTLALKPQIVVGDMGELFDAVKAVVTGEAEDASLEAKLKASIEANAKKAK